MLSVTCCFHLKLNTHPHSPIPRPLPRNKRLKNVFCLIRYLGCSVRCCPLSQSIDIPRVDELLQEFATIQQTSSKRIALLGSRHVPITHQNLIEMMSYALVLEGNRLITSGATGTNFAAIRGALRADPTLLTVILPQSLERQPRESRDQLEQVMHLVENPSNDTLSLAEASALCNAEIVSRCQQLICFAFHDSQTLLNTCREAEEQRKIVTLFYFD